MNKNNLVKYSIVLLVFFGSFFGTQFILNNYFKPENSIDEMVITLNKSCPKKISNEITLDSITINEKNLNYFYSLNYQDKEKFNVSDFKLFIKPKLIDLYQKSDEKKVIQASNYNLVFHCKDAFRESISEIIITPKEYIK
jgi:hypothetical protein